MRDEVELTPDAAVTGRWSLASAIVVAVTTWLLILTDGNPLFWMLAVASAVVAVVFIAQFLAPRAFAWKLGPAGLRLHHPLRPISAPWSAVHLARVVRSAGEPALELHLDVDRERQVRTVTLPIGADVAALHEGLERWLGPAHPVQPPPKQPPPKRRPSKQPRPVQPPQAAAR